MTTIAEIRARRAAITPGEWYWNAPYNVVLCVNADNDNDKDYVLACQNDNMGDARPDPADAAFIAAAPADIGHLLATIDKLTAALVEARAGLRMASAFSNDEMGLFDDEKPYYDDARRTIKQEFGL